MAVRRRSAPSAAGGGGGGAAAANIVVVVVSKPLYCYTANETSYTPLLQQPTEAGASRSRGEKNMKSL